MSNHIPLQDLLNGLYSLFKKGDTSTRRNTVDLQIKEGAGTRIRSRANTLELKLNGDIVRGNTEDMPSTPRVPRTLSVKTSESANGSASNSPSSENRQNVTIDNSQTWSAFNPKRQFYLLKAVFIVLCLVDIMHWAYLLRFVELSFH
ncbi:hypothetical protein OSTOST_18296, partial [Ostertagia ostertagi]